MTIPTLPDNLTKVCFFLAFVSFAYGYFQYESASTNFKKSSMDYITVLDSINKSGEKTNFQIDSLNQVFNSLKKKQDQEYAELPTDTSNHLAYSKKVKIRLSKLQKLIDSMSLVNAKSTKIWEADKKNVVPSIVSQAYEFSKGDLSSASTTKTTTFIIGLMLVILGLFELYRIQKIQDELLLRQLGEKEKYYPYCQSCGKNFTSMREYGKRNDGTKNKAFCSECFENGFFREPDITFEEIKKRAIIETKDKKQLFFKTKLIVKLENLERWKNTDYS